MYAKLCCRVIRGVRCLPTCLNRRQEPFGQLDEVVDIALIYSDLLYSSTMSPSLLNKL